MAEKEIRLRVPIQLLKNTNGLALDMGGSVLKVCCRAKDSVDDDLTNGKARKGYLLLASFPKQNFHQALEYIKQRTHVTGTGNELPEVTATGLRCMEFGKAISEALHIRMKILLEFQCFVKAFTYFASALSLKEMLEEIDEVVVRKAEEEMGAALAAMLQMDERNQFFEEFCLHKKDLHLPEEGRNVSEESLAKDENIYPCILIMCGSGFGYIRVNEDASFTVLDLNLRGGKAFHGIGKLLTRCKDFDELLELGSRGNCQNVDTCVGDFQVNSDDSTYGNYEEMQKNYTVYSFGKAAETSFDNFKREDLARTWLDFFATDIAQDVVFLANLHNIKRVFFSGSFCDNPVVQSSLSRELTKRRMFWNSINPKTEQCFQYDFVKHGSYLGTLGALITQMETATTENIQMLR